MMSQPPETLYLVIELRDHPWHRSGGASYFFDMEVGTPVQSFATREEAEVFCVDYERQRRGEVNPFDYGPRLEDVTPFDAGRFHDWILDIGLEPPTAKHELAMEDWIRWWNERCPTMTELQQAKMWQALAKVQLCRVVELNAAAEW